MTIPLDDLKPGTWYVVLYANGYGERRCIRGQYIRQTIERDMIVSWAPKPQSTIILHFLFPVYPQGKDPPLIDYEGIMRFLDVICFWEEPA